MSDEGRELEIADALRGFTAQLEAMPNYRELIVEERRRRRAWTTGLAVVLVLIVALFFWDRHQRMVNADDARCGIREAVEANHETLVLAVSDLFGDTSEAQEFITELERRYEQSDYALAEALPAGCDTLDPDLLPTTVP